jgi:hypothetical protein
MIAQNKRADREVIDIRLFKKRTGGTSFITINERL